MNTERNCSDIIRKIIERAGKVPEFRLNPKKVAELEKLYPIINSVAEAFDCNLHGGVEVSAAKCGAISIAFGGLYFALEYEAGDLFYELMEKATVCRISNVENGNSMKITFTFSDLWHRVKRGEKVDE